MQNLKGEGRKGEGERGREGRERGGGREGEEERERVFSAHITKQNNTHTVYRNTQYPKALLDVQSFTAQEMFPVILTYGSHFTRTAMAYTYNTHTSVHILYGVVPVRTTTANTLALP